MWDAVYVVITILFFAAMLWYVAGCKSLGASTDADAAEEGRGPSNGRRNGHGDRK